MQIVGHSMGKLLAKEMSVPLDAVADNDGCQYSCVDTGRAKKLRLTYLQIPVTHD